MVLVSGTTHAPPANDHSETKEKGLLVLIWKSLSREHVTTSLESTLFRSSGRTDHASSSIDSPKIAYDARPVPWLWSIRTPASVVAIAFASWATLLSDDLLPELRSHTSLAGAPRSERLARSPCHGQSGPMMGIRLVTQL